MWTSHTNVSFGGGYFFLVKLLAHQYMSLGHPIVLNTNMYHLTCFWTRSELISICILSNIGHFLRFFTRLNRTLLAFLLKMLAFVDNSSFSSNFPIFANVFAFTFKDKVCLSVKSCFRLDANTFALFVYALFLQAQATAWVEKNCEFANAHCAETRHARSAEFAATTYLLTLKG